MTTPIELKILSLNVWGIPFVSRDRKLRIAAIATELSTGKYDIVSLQEVWSKTDCQLIKEQTESTLPYSHYFYSGVMGAGLLVLSKYPILSTLFHAWSVNGYFHRIQHADWFGGKGVGLCRILIGQQLLHLYNAHLHAEYDNENDEYKTHRVIQAFDTAQFIRATRNDAALQVLAGDLNTPPDDICYNILLHISEMTDCCNLQTAATNCCPRNSYTTARALLRNPQGIRIDHVFTYSTEKLRAIIMDYKLPFAPLVPGQKFSYSDHEAVLVQVRLEINKHAVTEIVEANGAAGDGVAPSKLHKNLTSNCANGITTTKRLAVLHEAIELCENALQKLNLSRIFHYTLALLMTFVLIALLEYSVPAGYKILYMLLKFVIFGVLLFALFMASIWNFMERNGILAEQKAMEIMLHSLELGWH